MTTVQTPDLQAEHTAALSYFDEMSGLIDQYVEAARTRNHVLEAFYSERIEDLRNQRDRLAQFLPVAPTDQSTAPPTEVFTPPTVLNAHPDAQEVANGDAEAGK